MEGGLYGEGGVKSPSVCLPSGPTRSDADVLTSAMRAAAAAMLLVVLLAALCAASAAPAAHYGRGSRPRTIRGFKNVALSTARGFGKRDGAQQLDAGDVALPDSFPVEWFAAEMQNTPELARMVISKFVDANQDGELTAEELLRPTY